MYIYLQKIVQIKKTFNEKDCNEFNLSDNISMFSC